MAEVLACEVSEPEAVPVESVRSISLLGIGSGIYYGRFHQSIRDWMDHLPPAKDSAPAVFLFSTEGLPALWQMGHRPLRGALQRKGYRVIQEFHCAGRDTYGPLWLIGGLNRKRPDEHDLELARQFARNLPSPRSAVR
jgi:flavodoxin